MDITLDALIRSVQERSADALTQLDAASETAAELGELGDALLNHFVDRCRRSGHTWAEIGQHLGVTRQAAQKRFVSSTDSAVSFERFTARARAAIERGRESARSLQHNYIGTEHLLLGLLGVEDGIAAKVLERLGVRRATVEDGVLGRIGRGPKPVEADPPFTPRARRALEQTLVSAVAMGHNYIGTEHILLGVLSERDGVAAKILEANGVTTEAAQLLVVEMLSGYKAT